MPTNLRTSLVKIFSSSMVVTTLVAALNVASVTVGFTANAAPKTSIAIGTKGSEIAYDKKKLAAKAGAVEIKFTNNASPDSGMPHNFMLLKPGSSIEELGAAAMAAGAAKNYVPDSPAVIKATALLSPGQSETVKVNLEPGVYPYFCSYPGHPALMNGLLTVK